MSEEEPRMPGFGRRSMLWTGAGLAAAATAATAGGIAAAGPAAAAERLTAARFSLTIDGHEIASFAELAGLTSEVRVLEFAEGTEDGGTGIRLSPGRRLPSEITLKRGITRNLELAAWHDLVLSGDLAAIKQAVLIAYAPDSRPVARWSFTNAWPKKLEAASLAGDDQQQLVETVTIVCERIQRVSV